MLLILLILGFILGIVAIALYFYKRIAVVRKRIAVVRQIGDVLDNLRRYPRFGMMDKNIDEIEQKLMEIIQELKK